MTLIIELVVQAIAEMFLALFSRKGRRAGSVLPFCIFIAVVGSAIVVPWLLLR